MKCYLSSLYFQFGTVACVNGTFDCKKGRVFVSYKEKQGALNALETMLITKEYHLQVTNAPSSGSLCDWLPVSLLKNNKNKILGHRKNLRLRKMFYFYVYCRY
jgi:hypothetical protein